MDNTFEVRLRKALGNLRGDLDRLFDSERSCLEPLLERLSLVVRHDDEQPSVVSCLDIVNRADVPVMGRRGRLGLAQEALLGAVVVAPLRREELQGNESPQPRVARGVHHAHAAATELGEHLVVSDCRADERVGHSGLCLSW